MVEARREFEFTFNIEGTTDEERTTFETAFREQLSSDENLYNTLLEKAMQDPVEELVQRLDMLTVEESKGPVDQKLHLDLTSF